jgi:hypothetical protein
MVAGESSLSYTDSKFRIVGYSVIAEFKTVRSHQDLPVSKEQIFSAPSTAKGNCAM